MAGFIAFKTLRAPKSSFPFSGFHDNFSSHVQEKLRLFYSDVRKNPLGSVTFQLAATQNTHLVFVSGIYSCLTNLYCHWNIIWNWLTKSIVTFLFFNL